jgi:CubicO group peptidase (beta-lactamase class C family)
VKKLQFRVLYREFLFRIVDLELLSAHAEGDSRTLLGQVASILIFFGMVLAAGAGVWATSVRGGALPPLMQMVGAWTVEHFLIATTMLVVGLFAVLSWESTFPDRRDVLVLGPLPVRSGTLFLAKVAAVATALGLTLAALHGLAGIAWPLALAQYDSTPAPALGFDPPLPPVHAADFPAVMNRDIAPMLRRLDLAAADGGAGIVIGVSERGVRRVMTYGAAKPDSLFEIGSITKTFTGLLLAQMAVEKKLDLRDPVRELLPPGVASAPKGSFEITLLDLATHHSGLPGMPDNPPPGDLREMFTNYHAADLYDFIKRHGVAKSTHEKFAYSNLGFTVLGAALATRAGASYPELLQREITGPLGMKDTVISLSPELLGRLMQGYDGQRQPTPRWDLDAFASAGGIRSTAGDMLTYLEAQLHPERTPFPRALAASQRIREHVAGNMDVALAWMYDQDNGVYLHSGATGGYTTYDCFVPKRDFAAVVMFNAYSAAFPFTGMLSEHVVDRISGKPALSLAPISVPPAGPIRSFFAYWITMLSAGVFIFCCVLSLQGFTALLPRRWSLRASAFLQLAVFCLLVSGYFLQRSPATVLVTGSRQPWLSWIPSYWFVGMYQQLSGSLHPALAPFARRAWIGLAVALCATAGAYAASYFRTIRKILEQPDISPGHRTGWLPHLGGSFETAIAQFSVRSLLRSRQHRMIFAFYLGLGFAFAILFLNAPPEVTGPAEGGPWDPLSVPLLASTVLLMGLWVLGARAAFSLPLDLRANWIFRSMPFTAGRQCLNARRRALFAVSVTPALLLSAAVLFSLWPWRLAAAHLAVLAFLGIILAEFSFDGVQRMPFTCSYLPGESNLHLTFWLWFWLLLMGLIGAVVNERTAFGNSAATIAVLAGLGIVALFCVVRNNRSARPVCAELRFEEIPPDRLLSLDLS